jgi:hypothetical protein
MVAAETCSLQPSSSFPQLTAKKPFIPRQDVLADPKK